MDDDIFDYDWSQGGGDWTYFGDNTIGDTSWIDNFDWSNAINDLDFSKLDLSSFDFGNDYFSGKFNPFDIDAMDWDTSSLSPFDLDALSNVDQANTLTFFNPDGSTVRYEDITDPGAMVSTMDPNTGRNVFYHSTDGDNYVIDYSDTTPGSFVETFRQSVDGGPTRYDAYSGMGDEAKHVTYSDVYGPQGGTITTTSDGKKYQYENGKVYELDDKGNRREIKDGGGGGGKQTPAQKLQQMIDARKTSIRLPDVPELERFTPGRGALFNPFGGQGEIPLARLDLGSIGNIFPSESVLDRLAGQMPIRVAEGGSIEGEHNPEFYSEGGSRYVRGNGDGTSDSVPAMLARGEYVIPADVVSNLGNGDNEAGAEIMDEFLNVVRSHKRSAHPEDLPEDSKGPLAYLEEAQKNVRD